MKKLCFILLFPIALAAYHCKEELPYVFPSTTFTLDLGYEHQQVSFGYRERDLPQKENTHEKLKNIQNFLIGAEASYLEPRMPYAKALLDFAFGWSGTDHWKMSFLINNDPSQEVADGNTYKASAFRFRARGEAGYPFRLGRLAFVPFLGWGFQRQYFKRSDVHPRTTDSSLFFPQKKFWYSFLTPLVGLKLIILSRPYSRFQLEADYFYSFGWFHLHSKYQVDTLQTSGGTTTVRNTHESFKVERFGSIQSLELLGTWGLTESWFLSLSFQYAYAKSGSGSAREKVSGDQILLTAGSVAFSPVDELKSAAFLGFHSQSYGTELKLSYGF
jgi:hypothetical protein